ncbi:cathepsin B-like protease 2 [Capsicum annuum]
MGIDTNGILQRIQQHFFLQTNSSLGSVRTDCTRVQRVIYRSLRLFEITLEMRAVFDVVAQKPISKAKGESAILQESIIKEVNENPKAGWKAAFTLRFSNFTVSQFKLLLGVKPPREGDLEGIHVLTYPKFKELPKEFDARKA